MKTCYIFGAMPVSDVKIKLNDDDMIIAADAGLITTDNLKLKPDYIVGDFDSLKYVPQGDNIIQHPKMKNETDLILAVDIALEKGYNNFKIYGCLGGRLDQTIASIQTLAYIQKHGGKGVLLSKKESVSLIKNSSISFTSECRGAVSVFSYSKNCHGVEIEGLLYTLNHADVTNKFPLGVSNEFKGEEAKISVEEGTLVVIWNSKTGDYILGD